MTSDILEIEKINAACGKRMKSLLAFVGRRVPEICPVFAHIEFILAHCLANIVFHELPAIALDKIEAPGVKADVILQPVEPIDEALSEVLI